LPRILWGHAVLLVALLVTSDRCAGAQGQEQTVSLVLRFRQTRDVSDKERILDRIVQRGSEAGRLLLDLAKRTEDNDTRWLAIRGLGILRFEHAAPFLIESLKSGEHYVRANAARALGELRYSYSVPALIPLLESEQDAGVIEQTSLALRLMKAQDAIPVIKSRMSFNSMQTRCWLLDAIGDLGSRMDAAFIAKYLYGDDTASIGLSLCAARSLAALTGEDFGLPKGSGIFDPQAPVLKARKWWEQTQKQDGAK
jgi:HEAT repeat protein